MAGMSILEIAAMPTVVKEVPANCNGIHESMLRSYQILALVKRWLADNTPPSIVLEVIAVMESGKVGGETL